MTIEQVASGTAIARAVWQLREAVLRKPIGLSLHDEDLSAEENDLVFAAKEGDAVVGCLLLRTLDNGKGKLRQMAVDPDYQHRGIGRALLDAAEAYALEEGLLWLELHARQEAVAFYENAGYHPSGEPFTQVGIPHLKMAKTLSG